MALTKVHNRMIKGSVVNVLDYAAGDGVTNDRDAIQAAINAGDVIYFPPTANGYLVSGTGSTSDRIVITGGKKIIGDERLTKIIHSNDEWLFDLRGSDIEIDGFFIDSTAASTASRGAMILRTDLSSMENIRIRNIETYKSRHGIRDIADASNIIVDMVVERFVCRLHNGPGMSFEAAYAYITFDHCTIDYVNGSSINHIAYYMKNNRGSQWKSCDATGGTVDGTTTGQTGFYFYNCVAVWLDNCMADTLGNNGYQMYQDCEAFYFTNCVASLCGSSGFAAGSGCTQIQLANCTSKGRAGLGYAPANSHGFHSDTAVGTLISNSVMSYNTGNGVYLEQGNRYNISGSMFTDNGVYGIKSDATSVGIISACNFASNGTADINLSSANEHAVNCQLNSGALGNLTGSGTL